MSVGLHELAVGEEVELKGPLGSFTWLGQGSGMYKGRTVQPRNLGLICGGSGLTPMLQIVHAVLEDTYDTTTKLWLLFANKTEQDVLCREELEQLAKDHPDRIKVHFTIEEVPPTPWSGSIGRVSDAMLKDHLPAPGADSLALFCGPEPMLKFAVNPGLERLGWNVATNLVLF
jgi:nitrate reductase (NAD(P)H)